VHAEAVREVPIHAHQEAANWLADQGEQMKQRFADSPDDPHGAEVEVTEIVIPDQTFADRRALDLGDRVLELIFPGRGHTSGDIVARLMDC
jgi:glyoxylase-like metal-dependent hydrolase (beta-lactamase superfamily II)